MLLNFFDEELWKILITQNILIAPIWNFSGWTLFLHTITHSQVGHFELHKRKFLDEEQQHILNDSRYGFKQDY